eukprot:1259393-Amphidinium_carterae.1
MSISFGISACVPKLQLAAKGEKRAKLAGPLKGLLDPGLKSCTNKAYDSQKVALLVIARGSKGTLGHCLFEDARQKAGKRCRVCCLSLTIMTKATQPHYASDQICAACPVRRADLYGGAASGKPTTAH